MTMSPRSRPGLHNGAPLGSWDLSQLTPTTSWNLSFDPFGMVFPTGGMHDGPRGRPGMPAAAPMTCGTPGSASIPGHNAQDLCVNDTWIHQQHDQSLYPVSGLSRRNRGSRLAAAFGDRARPDAAPARG